MFRLFGFDVHVRTGFVVFLVLVVAINPGPFGVWIAGGLAVFTLLHELGHAVAARNAGAEASISLDFLAGYTSFRPSRPLSRTQRAVITVAGPATQIAVSVAVLFGMGATPWSLDSVRQTDATYAIWWAGPVIGLLNLIPVLPLDGGHLAQTALEPILGRDPTRKMAIASLGITIAAAAAFYVSGYRGFTIFVAFLLFTQYQIVQATSRAPRKASPHGRSAAAEAQAWQSGRPGMLEPGQRISPWFEAHRALGHGDEGGAMGVMLADLRSTATPTWAPPTAAPRASLRAIVDVLPSELPHGNSYSSRILAEVLAALGQYERAGRYAVDAFAEHRTAGLAVVVARAAAASGDDANALRWLDAAADAADQDGPGVTAMLTQVIDAAPELDRLRTGGSLDGLRARLG